MIIHLSPCQAAPPPARPSPTAAAPQRPERAARAAEPPRGELHVGIGAQGGATSWPGDPIGYGAFTVGLRLFRVITPFLGGALGYARVDQRLLTRLSFGIMLHVPLGERFYLRGKLGVVHQHEESLAAVAQEPFGATLGIGTGIRHRAGAIFGLGFDVVARRTADYVVTVGPDVTANYLTYSSGPSWYYLVGVSAAAHVRLF